MCLHKRNRIYLLVLSVNTNIIIIKNSKIPIRYMQWGSVQNIDNTEQEIGTGCQHPAPVCDQKKIKLRTTKEILDK